MAMKQKLNLKNKLMNLLKEKYLNQNLISEITNTSLTYQMRLKKI